jgi:hypothetical protein
MLFPLPPACSSSPGITSRALWAKAALSGEDMPVIRANLFQVFLQALIRQKFYHKKQFL